MVSDVYSCPLCQKPESVIKFGTNRCGTQKLRCKDCQKVFTPQPKSQTLSDAQKQQILNALAERLSLRAIARTFGVSRNTITALLEKK